MSQRVVKADSQDTSSVMQNYPQRVSTLAPVFCFFSVLEPEIVAQHFLKTWDKNLNSKCMGRTLVQGSSRPLESAKSSAMTLETKQTPNSFLQPSIFLLHLYNHLPATSHTPSARLLLRRNLCLQLNQSNVTLTLSAIAVESLLNVFFFPLRITATGSRRRRKVDTLSCL